MKMFHRIFQFAVISLLSILLCGCHTTNQCPNDPFENFNRNIYSINKAVDHVAIKPVATLYWNVVPQPARMGIGNFFDNIREITNMANDLLQWRFDYLAKDTGRFLINSTFGIGGLFDVAGRVGIHYHKNDFGQTLYRWGYKESAYLVIPFLGPSTFRDGIGFGVDYTVLSVWPWVDKKWRLILLGIDAVDARGRLLEAEKIIDTAAIDEYTFVRDAYLQHRQFVFNGEVEAEEEVDPYDDIELDAGSSDPEQTITNEEPSSSVEQSNTENGIEATTE